MEHSLEQADVLRDRLNATYAEVKAALDACDGDLLSALAHIEQQRAASQQDVASVVTAVVQEVGRAASNGRITQVRIKLRDAVVASIPVALVGVGAAVATGLGALLTSCAVDFERTAEGTDAHNPGS